MKQHDNRNKGANRTQNMRFYPFVSNGKEKDHESGFHYYGARYYWSELLTGWLSVDPMADKYPNISPYAYCAWNPMKLVDPDGKEIDDYFTNDGRYLGSDNAKTHNVRIINENCWNALDKDENGNALDHGFANQLSTAFSDASKNMTEESQLGVYQHYNPTECELYSLKPDGHYGMRSQFEPGKKPILPSLFAEMIVDDSIVVTSPVNTWIFEHNNDVFEYPIKIYPKERYTLEEMTPSSTRRNSSKK